MKLAGDPNNPARFDDNATADELPGKAVPIAAIELRLTILPYRLDCIPPITDRVALINPSTFT